VVFLTAEMVLAFAFEADVTTGGAGLLATFGAAVTGVTTFLAGAFFATGCLLGLALAVLAGVLAGLAGALTALVSGLGATLVDFEAGLAVLLAAFTGFATVVEALAVDFTGLVKGAFFALGLAWPLGADFVADFMLGLLASNACAFVGAGEGALSFLGSPCVIPLLGSFFAFFA
jgi:hypothetical protein